ncbi:hypothetical protein, partial [Clostridium tepidiprofundi]|uniref:hypothetical protein n=1 Tax=Clostridium tepidiprofundi TaxID=420412 RepID=UPI000B1463A2
METLLHLKQKLQSPTYRSGSLVESIKTLWSEFQQLKKVEINKSEKCSWVKEIGYKDRTVNIIETSI